MLKILKHFINWFIICSVLFLCSCGLKQGYVKIEDQEHYIIPKPEIAEIKLNPVKFNIPEKQSSGICFETYQDAKNYLNNLATIESYINQQKNIIEYYDKNK